MDVGFALKHQLLGMQELLVMLLIGEAQLRLMNLERLLERDVKIRLRLIHTEEILIA